MSKLIPLNDKNMPIGKLMKPTFETFEGVVQDGNIEEKLLEYGFTPIEKIITQDDKGNMMCNYIKARDQVGRAVYIELDCDYRNGMGFVKMDSNDSVLSKSNEASVIPYSLKMGTYESTKADISGVSFECDDSICIMSRKDSSLEPTETIFSHNKEVGIVSQNPVPFPIVKITDIMSNPDAVRKSVITTHNRMRNIAFNYCEKEVESIKENIENLQKEIVRFDKLAKEYSSLLASTINELENMHSICEKQKTKNEENVKSIRFNLTKRNDLTLDYISLCSSMKERSEKIAELFNEIKAINDFSETLFSGLPYVFTE